MEYKDSKCKEFKKAAAMLQQHIAENGEIPTVGSVAYDTARGRAEGEFLRKEENLGVQVLRMDEDTPFPLHTHVSEWGDRPCIEWGHVFKGRVSVVKNGVAIECGVGESFFCGFDEAHEGLALEDSEILFVSIPAAKGYPNAT